MFGERDPQRGPPKKKRQKAPFVAAVSRGRGDAGDGVRHPAADRPDAGADPSRVESTGALCLWNLLVDRGFINGREIRGLNGQTRRPVQDAPPRDGNPGPTQPPSPDAPPAYV